MAERFGIIGREAAEPLLAFGRAFVAEMAGWEERLADALTDWSDRLRVREADRRDLMLLELEQYERQEGN